MSAGSTQREAAPNRLLVVWLVVALVHGAAVGLEMIRDDTPIPLPDEIAGVALIFASTILIAGTGIWLLICLLGWLWRWAAATDGERINGRVAAVLICTFVALVAASVRVPAHELRYGFGEGRPAYWWSPDAFAWCGDVLAGTNAATRAGWGGPFGSEWRVDWSFLIAEWALIFLLGGGRLTWVVRRERRRAA